MEAATITKSKKITLDGCGLYCAKAAVFFEDDRDIHLHIKNTVLSGGETDVLSPTGLRKLTIDQTDFEDWNLSPEKALADFQKKARETK